MMEKDETERLIAAEKREAALRTVLEKVRQQIDDLGYSANVGTDHITDVIDAALAQPMQGKRI